MARRSTAPPANAMDGNLDDQAAPDDGSARPRSPKPTRPESIGRRAGESNGAAAMAMAAKFELSAITGLDVDHVSAVTRQDDGWHVVVDLVELRRIPSSTDVLAAYEAVLGPTGILLSYRRTRRYLRDQMLDPT